jgi:uncharacterized ion transporter superfamily protein YfcC
VSTKPFLERIKVPHVFVLLTGAVFVCSLLTYVIPSGEYERETITVDRYERTVVKAGTYRPVPKHVSVEGVLVGESREGRASPVSVTGFLSAIPRGMERSAGIIFFIFIIGGVLGILQRTGVIAAFLHRLLDALGHRANLLTVTLMVVVGVGGSTLGMGEEFIPLIPIFLIVAKELGYDRVYGMAIVYLAATVGFAAATTNPFTVNIANGIAELPPNNGIPFRVAFFICCMVVTIGYLLRYGSRIRRDRSASLMPNDRFELGGETVDRVELTRRHGVIMIACGVIFVGILASVELLGWWLAEMAGGFLLMGMVAIAVSRLPLADAAAAFVKGMEEMVVAALVVGFARGIEVVLADGQILDTLIFSAAGVLQQFPKIVAAVGMLVFQSSLNLLIPSGSWQAAVTMPLMAPLADVLGITRQTAVFAFTCGDGFSNSIIPTSGILMAMLSLARIPYTTWLRFMLPLFLIMMGISVVFLMVSVWIPAVWWS